MLQYTALQLRGMIHQSSSFFHAVHSTATSAIEYHDFISNIAKILISLHRPTEKQQIPIYGACARRRMSSISRIAYIFNETLSMIVSISSRSISINISVHSSIHSFLVTNNYPFNLNVRVSELFTFRTHAPNYYLTWCSSSFLSILRQTVLRPRRVDVIPSRGPHAPRTCKSLPLYWVLKVLTITP